MRNSNGVEIKRGHWVSINTHKGSYQGYVVSVNVRDKTLTLDDGYMYRTEDVTQTLGPMVVGPGGVVTQNPLSRVKVGSKSQRTGAAPTKRLRERRKATNKAPAGFYANPLTRVKVGSPSQLTGEPPSARLRQRRKATAKAPAGVYANPAGYVDNYAFRVQVKMKDGSWKTEAGFPRASAAKEYARALHKLHPSQSVRVVE